MQADIPTLARFCALRLLFVGTGKILMSEDGWSSLEVAAPGATIKAWMGLPTGVEYHPTGIEYGQMFYSNGAPMSVAKPLAAETKHPLGNANFMTTGLLHNFDASMAYALDEDRRLPIRLLDVIDSAATTPDPVIRELVDNILGSRVYNPENPERIGRWEMSFQAEALLEACRDSADEELFSFAHDAEREASGNLRPRKYDGHFSLKRWARLFAVTDKQTIPRMVEMPERSGGRLGM